MNNKFSFKTVVEADYSRSYNGNNGNYDVLDVYYNNQYVCTVTDCDWNIIRSNFIENRLAYSKPIYTISNGVVYKIETDNWGDDVAYQLSKDGNWNPADQGKTMLKYAPCAPY